MCCRRRHFSSCCVQLAGDGIQEECARYQGVSELHEREEHCSIGVLQMWFSLPSIRQSVRLILEVLPTCEFTAPLSVKCEVKNGEEFTQSGLLQRPFEAVASGTIHLHGRILWPICGACLSLSLQTH